MTSVGPIRFDDVEALSAAANGAPGAWSVEAEISQEMINRFAELTGDHQWLHVDVERCRTESPFNLREIDMVNFCIPLLSESLESASTMRCTWSARTLNSQTRNRP